MGIQDLLVAVEARSESAKAKAKEEAEYAIAQHSATKEATFKLCFPSLFANENPIEKWVMIEPDSSSCGGDESKALAAIIDVDGHKIILYIYRSSCSTTFGVAKYERGSSDCWAKKPVYSLSKALNSNAEKSEEALVSMIRQLTKEG